MGSWTGVNTRGAAQAIIIKTETDMATGPVGAIKKAGSEAGAGDPRRDTWRTPRRGGIIPSASRAPPTRAAGRDVGRPDPTRPGGTSATASAGRAELTRSPARLFPPANAYLPAFPPSLVAFRALVCVCMCRRGRESTTRHRASRAKPGASAQLVRFPSPVEKLFTLSAVSASAGNVLRMYAARPPRILFSLSPSLLQFVYLSCICRVYRVCISSSRNTSR
jgi:hypothetical protein